jgi:hypothetical protein
MEITVTFKVDDEVIEELADLSGVDKSVAVSRLKRMLEIFAEELNGFFKEWIDVATRLPESTPSEALQVAFKAVGLIWRIKIMERFLEEIREVQERDA